MSMTTGTRRRVSAYDDRRAGPLIKQVITIFVLARVSAFLARALVEGATTLLEGAVVSAVVSIAVAGMLPLGLVIRSIGSIGLPIGRSSTRACPPV
jgi:hypothetical protein